MASIFLEPNNPSARLLNLLRAIKRAGRDTHSKTLVGEALAEVLGLTYPDDLGELLQASSLVLSLPAQHREAVATFPYDPTKMLDRFSNIEEALAGFALQRPAHTVAAKVPEAALVQLEMAEDLVRQHYSEPFLSEVDEQELLDLLSDLLTGLPGDLSSVAEDFLRRHVGAIQSAVLRARIGGIGPVESALFETVGELRLRPEVQVEVAGTSRGKTLAKALGIIGAALAITHQALQLPADVDNLRSKDAPPPSVVVNIDNSDEGAQTP